jgi:ubiquinone biosynthesis protein
MTHPRLLAQEVRRTRDIFRVFARHGLGDLVAHLKVPGRWHPRRGTQDAGHARATRLRMALEELGPTFVKFGQALSIRSDLLPLSLTTELARLQDDAPPLPAGTVESVIAQELGAPIETLFRDFDPVPIGAASIAQVHRAILPSGDQVAVKVRRPGIGATIDGDLAILQSIAASAERHWADAELFVPSALVRQFARTIRREQDFTREGRIIERFAANFAGDPTVIVPRVHWSHTCAAVLTMDYVDGIKVSDIDALRLQGSDPALVARRGADAILQQVLTDGLFHADPHPGNILVLPGSVICLLDFGIIGHLGRPGRDRLARLVQAIGARDIPRVVRIVLALSEPLVEPDIKALEEDAAELVETYAGARLQDLSMARVWADIADVIGRHRLQLPADLMLLVKTLVTMEGVGHRLDPTFRMIEHATPYVRRVLMERWSPPRALRLAGREGRDLVDALRAMPDDVHAILAKARAGGLSLHVRQDDLAQVAGRIDVAGRRISLGLVLAALLMSTATIAAAGSSPTRAVTIVAGIIALLLLAAVALVGPRHKAAPRRPRQS